MCRAAGYSIFVDVVVIDVVIGMRENEDSTLARKPEGWSRQNSKTKSAQ